MTEIVNAMNNTEFFKSTMKVKAISLHEPYASLIRTGAKTYETRTWATNYRGPLLICAAKGGLSAIIMANLLRRYCFQKGLGLPIDTAHLWHPSFVINTLRFGKAVALVEITHCIPTSELGRDDIGEEGPFGDFAHGRYAWKLKMLNNTFEPFHARGRQRLFEVELSKVIKI